MAIKLQAKLLEKIKLKEDVYHFKVQAQEIVKTAKPGHFIEIRVSKNTEPFLRSGTFKYDKYQNIAVIGGGIGVFPLYELCKEAKNDSKNVNTYLGFRNKDFVLLENEFKEVSDNLIITTDDGSYANKGFAINYLEKDIEEGKFDCIYACGPLPMLKAVRELAIKKDISCQISLEERMGCGLGVCLGCAVKTARSSKENPEYWHVCKGGPVFEAKDVEI